MFGASLGSFANVCIYRLPRDKQIISGRSYCPRCKKKLTWRENIPLVSYLIQRGKCISCNESISLKYPLVELITGILFIFFAVLGPGPRATKEEYESQVNAMTF